MKKSIQRLLRRTLLCGLLVALPLTALVFFFHDKPDFLYTAYKKAPTLTVNTPDKNDATPVPVDFSNTELYQQGAERTKNHVPPFPRAEENSNQGNALQINPEKTSSVDKTSDVQAPRVSTDPDWKQLEPGLEYGEFPGEGIDVVITAIRIDPEIFDFILCAAGNTDGKARTLAEWGQQKGLVVAINASMYLPDGKTSTGYMRDENYINNNRIVQRFGAFLVSKPDAPDLPKTAIIDKDMPDWKELQGHYGLVIQNYRIINAQRRILWSPGGPHYSISAIAQDGDGQILFLHSRDRIEAYLFAQQLLHLPLNVRTVMYVEGGAQAGLLVRSPSLNHVFTGKNAMDFLVTGNIEARLPNVIGAKRRER